MSSSVERPPIQSVFVEALNRGEMTRLFFPSGQKVTERPAGLTDLILSERGRLTGIAEFLSHTECKRLVHSGQLTFGAIKPRTHESKLGVLNDLEGEKQILSMIKRPLDVVFTVTLVPEEEEIEDFYAKEIKERVKGISSTTHANAWEEYKAYMLSGPVTYFVLYDPTGQAINNWRRQMGPTDLSDSESIRGRFALDRSHNLLHGSDSKEAVAVEFDWLLDKIERHNTLESFFGIVTPAQLKRHAIGLVHAQALEAGQPFSYSQLGANEREKERLRREVEKIVKVLESKEVVELITNNNITLAMIRPQAYQNKKHISPDGPAARAILARVEELQPDLLPVFTISLVMDEQLVEAFYKGAPKKNQLQAPAVKYPSLFTSRWEEMLNLATSGPATFILFFSRENVEDRDAVRLWRDLIGHWDVGRAERGTIRAEFVASNYNNLVHGSDSVESARREIGLLAKFLREKFHIR